MKRSDPSDIDTRGFRWPLAALQGRRALAVNEAAQHFSQAQRSQCALQAELACVEASYAEQVAAMAQAPAAAIDPGVRREALSYLAAASARMQVTRGRLERAEHHCEETRLRLQRADRDLQAVVKLREAALGDFIMQQRRAQAKQADLACLARRFAQGPAQ